MNKKRKTLFGNYNYSVRTSSEAVGVVFRKKEVISKLVLFITANVHLFYDKRAVFQFCNKIKINC